MATICRICRQPVHFEAGKGYVHDEGGGAYMMRCQTCGWEGAPAKPIAACPACGSRDVRDSHCVYVVDSDALAALESLERMKRGT